MRVLIALCVLALAAAFVPVSTRTGSRTAMKMSIDNYIGTATEVGFFDPLNLSEKDDETLRWYRAAELKHGRVCMLATLGIVVQGLGASLPNPIFQEPNAFKALGVIYEASPIALAQRFQGTRCHLRGFP